MRTDDVTNKVPVVRIDHDGRCCVMIAPNTFLMWWTALDQDGEQRFSSSYPPHTTPGSLTCMRALNPLLPPPNTESTMDELTKKLRKKAQDQLRTDRLGRVTRRAGIKAGPKTARRGAGMIKRRQRQAQTVELRLKNLSYREIGQITNVGTSQAERDLAAGIKDIVPIENAERAFRLEVARLAPWPLAISKQHVRAASGTRMQCCE
jgi:hypothetical protein